ncbi:MAG TPA: hypothetical protein VKU80_11630 [Planctomycetota bacterium]|nr:hypothetical protein [Planctomycetota bacterium]
MSRVLCDCGHVIRDGTDHLPYKAHFLPDQNVDILWTKIVTDLTEMVEMTLSGRRKEWLAKHFDERYSTSTLELSVSEQISDYFSIVYGNHTGKMYQCEGCGALLLYRGFRQSPLKFMPVGGATSALRKIGDDGI